MKKNSAIQRWRNAFRIRKIRRAGGVIGNNVIIGRNVQTDGPVIIGNNVVIHEGVVLNGNIRIGNGCRIEKLAELWGNISLDQDTTIGGYSYLSTMATGQINIGKDVQVNAFSVIGANERVEIGNHSIFAAYVQITDSTHGIDDPDLITKHAAIDSSPVFIGENVWLGSGAMVMMGSNVGAGSVIGAKSLVNSEVPPMSVAYGIPARVVRHRNARAG